MHSVGFCLEQTYALMCPDSSCERVDLMLLLGGMQGNMSRCCHVDAL